MARRRQSGMAANPISYADIEAFERKTLQTFSAWETDLIVRIDDTILGAMRPPPDSPAETEADVKDPKAVRGLLSGIRDRMRSKPKR